MPTRRRRSTDVEAAHGLGWASIGIGLLELAAPRQVQSMLGLRNRSRYSSVLRLLGVRELLHGVGILGPRKSSRGLAVGVASRVAGDMLDTALLGVAARKTLNPVRFGVIAGMVLGVGVLDMFYAK